MNRMAARFLVSDVHGHRADLVSGLAEAGLVEVSSAGADVRDVRWVSEDDTLSVLGDLTDRGPDGIGVIDLLMSLQRQAPEQVQVLLGNHEALTLGMKRYPNSRFADSWAINGGLRRDQDGLTSEHLDWLAGLPSLARVGDLLLMHSDTTEYLGWGEDVAQVNQTVRDLLASDDVDSCWSVWAQLTTRNHFAEEDGPAAARKLLDTLGGERIVHGHSVIGSLLEIASAEVEKPLLYADGLVLDIDGGRYDGGPLLVVRLD